MGVCRKCGEWTCECEVGKATCGPAFPHAHDKFPPPSWSTSSGMTLRDYFAALAMQGMLAVGLESQNYSLDPTAIAEWAYQQADEMLKAREAK